MRWSDESYEIGEVFTNVETGERFVCLDCSVSEDSYYDKIYVISEEEYLENKGETVREVNLDTFHTIHGCEVDEYERSNKEYDVFIETLYTLN